MKKLLWSLLLVSRIAQAQSNSQPEIYLLGSMHDMHMKADIRYSLIDLRHEVEAIHPDLVCVEIEPAAFNAPMEGYFPPEGAYLAALAPQMHTRVVPTDWRIATAWQNRADQQIPPEQAKRIKDSQQTIAERFKAAVDTPKVFEFVHGEMQRIADEQFMNVIGEDNAADISFGAWHERNRRIVENCLAASDGARKILFVYGGAHLPQLGREMRDRGLISHLAPKLYTPAGISPVPAEVIARWQRNLENLKAIRDGNLKTSIDNREKVKESNRIANLEEAIAVYSPRDQ